MSILCELNRLQLSTAAGRKLGRPISFCLRWGGIHLLRGENGSGKTTLLRWIFSPPAEATHATGMLSRGVKQSDTLFVPQIQNVSFHLPLTLGDVLDFAPLKSRDYTSVQLLSSAQIGRSWNTASGGERQRTLLTRALLWHPKLLLLDEPFNHLDSASQPIVVEQLQTLIQSGKIGGAVIVTHHSADLFGAARIPVTECTLSGGEAC